MIDLDEEIMTDEEALQYSLETLNDLEAHCDNDEQRAELAQVISVITSILDSYTTCTFGLVPVEDEEDEKDN